MRFLLAIPILLAACGPGPFDWERYAMNAQEAGLMRQDRAPIDAPYSNEDLIAAFEKIAFSFEADPFETGEAAPERPEIIRKVVNGPSFLVLNPDNRSRAILVNRMRRYLDRLAGLTGLTPQVYTSVAEFRSARDNESLIFVLQTNEEEFKKLSDVEAASDVIERGRVAQWFSEAVASWRSSRSPCGGRLIVSTGASPERPKGEILFVFLMFREGLPDIVLEGCIEEEFAQVLGLFNDDPTLRPSIFNDDDEFSRLTTHDEALLRLLYHPRIKPGMAKPEAMAIIRDLLAQGEIEAGS
ncbi:MAG: DUF2927 domain-containing protein [Pseudomonadota bacterium]